MKQMPVLSFLRWFCRPNSPASWRTSVFSQSPSGNKHFVAGVGARPVEISLIFVAVSCFLDYNTGFVTLPSRIVDGAIVSAQAFGIINELAEFDFAITQNVWVERSQSLIFSWKCSNTLSQYSAAKFAQCSGISRRSQTACASSKSAIAVQYSSRHPHPSFS